MDLKVLICIAFLLFSAAPVSSLPVGILPGGKEVRPAALRSLWKRFIDTSLSFGAFNHHGIGKVRTKRSAEPCEQLQLCRLHARSATSLVAAFQLYFVNKENAKLWDHRARSLQDCERRFSCDR